MGIRYVVRGAQAQCTSGSALINLNLSKSHGMYVNNKAVLNNCDREVGINIKPFGRCNVLDGPCSPSLACCWDNAQMNTILGGKPALITSSTLNCSNGGVITIVNDGQ